MLPRVNMNLSEGETIIFQGHPSWRAILGFYLKGIVVAIVLGIIAKLVSSTTSVFVVVLVVLALTVLVGFIKRWATTYTITTRRLNIKRGIISREIQETRLERVQNVNYNQSVYQRIMHIGDVDFDTAATRRLRLHLLRRRRPERRRRTGRPGDRRGRRREPRPRRAPVARRLSDAAFR